MIIVGGGIKVKKILGLFNYNNNFGGFFMLQFRYSFFETKSSSCHALIMSTSAETGLSSVIDLSEDSEKGDYIRQMVRDLPEDDTRKLVYWLFTHGVETIKYNGSNPFIHRCIEDYQALSDSQKEEIQWSNELPRLPHFTSLHLTDGALINFLMGEYRDYFGHDDYLYEVRDNGKDAYVISCE